MQIIKELIDGTNLTMKTVDGWVAKRFKKMDINACTEEEFTQLVQGVKKFIGG